MGSSAQHNNGKSSDDDEEGRQLFKGTDLSARLATLRRHVPAVVRRCLPASMLFDQCAARDWVRDGSLPQSHCSLCLQRWPAVAASVLQLQNAALDKALRQGGVHELRKQLCPGLFTATSSTTPVQQPVTATGRKSPVTDASYPLAFFSSFAEGKYETQSSGRSVLPPLHCSAVFPLRGPR